MDSLILSLDKMKPDTQKVNVLGSIGWELAFTDPQLSMVYCEKGLQLATQLKWTKGIANMNHALATTCEITGDYSKGMDANLKALDIRRSLHDTLGMGKSYGNIGNLYYAQGNILRALENYRLSAQMFQAIDEPRMLATTWVNIGVIYQNQADYPSSLNYLLKGLSIMERTGYTQGIGYAQSNLGVTYAGLGEYEKSVKAHEASLAIDRKENNQVGEALTLNNLGNTYYHLGQFDKAMRYLHEGYALFEKQGDQQGMASIIFDEAMILDKQGKTDEAIQRQLFALEIRLKDTGFVRPAAESCIHLAGMYLKKHETAKALRYSDKGLVYAIRSGDNNTYLEALRKRADVLMRTGFGEKAAPLLDRYIALHDSLFSSQRANELTRKELEFSFEKDRLADSLGHAVEQKRSALELEKRNAQLGQERIIRYFLFILAFLLLAVGYLIYRAYQRKQKDNVLILEQKKETELQKSLVEEKNKEILDSIYYARRIQYALLAKRELIAHHLPDHFIFFQPKDVVSGDFYWATQKFENLKNLNDSNIRSSNPQILESSNPQMVFYLAVCDSTGHGVPGAFMSLLNISFLNEAITEKNISDPSAVFKHVRTRLIENISQEGQKDGMDGILVKFGTPRSAFEIEYAAANLSPLLIRNGTIQELPFDKIPVGESHSMHQFNLYNHQLQKGDVLYLFTDGYADQFGGAKGKKFKYKNLYQLLQSIHHLPATEQENKLHEHFNTWKGDLEQVDDVCVIGIRL